MAKCGIRKYDELPGRVGLIDVDAARYALSEIDSDRWFSKLWFWHPAAFIGKIFLDEEKVRESIVENLEDARKIHNGDMKPAWKKYIDKVFKYCNF